MQVDLELRGFDALDRRIELSVARVRAKMTQLIAHHSRMLKIHARRNAPVESGELRNSISKIQQGLEAMVYSDAEHAPAIEFGARSHEIRPDEANALHFFWEKIGQEVYFAQVDHPGNEAQRFMWRAINRQWPQIKRSAKRILNNAL